MVLTNRVSIGILLSFIRFAAMAALLVSCASSFAQQTIADIVKQSSDAVVLIVISNSTGQETALGSGFLISSDGRIVTNYHVIKGAHSAIVKLSSGAFFPVASVLASDPQEDLAVLKVTGKNLPSLQLADHDEVHVGDHVVAIGSPLGLEGTVSDGIVSALREDGSKRWIQTTAPVSHGNSGGPLLDMTNHVVGVVSMGVNPQAGQNLNFAIPSAKVKELLNAPERTAPFDSTAQTDRAGAGDTVWTSITTGHDYSVRLDGQYVYVNRLDIPSNIKDAGGFVRFELTKSADGKWRGKSHARMPCEYRGGYPVRNILNWCTLEEDTGIDVLSERRIEGWGTSWTKFSCKKCEPENLERKPFTWIPK